MQMGNHEKIGHGFDINIYDETVTKKVLLARIRTGLL